jgi:hypothetical protein
MIILLMVILLFLLIIKINKILKEKKLDILIKSSKKIIVVHNGVFHADESLALALIFLSGEFEIGFKFFFLLLIF